MFSDSLELQVIKKTAVSSLWQCRYATDENKSFLPNTFAPVLFVPNKNKLCMQAAFPLFIFTGKLV